MKKSDFKCTDVGWILPNKKRPFWYTSVQTMYGINYQIRKYAKKHKQSPTVKQLRAGYKDENEETQLLDEMIRRGYGDETYKL